MEINYGTAHRFMPRCLTEEERELANCNFESFVEKYQITHLSERFVSKQKPFNPYFRQDLFRYFDYGMHFDHFQIFRCFHWRFIVLQPYSTIESIIKDWGTSRNVALLEMHDMTIFLYYSHLSWYYPNQTCVAVLTDYPRSCIEEHDSDAQIVEYTAEMSLRPAKSYGVPHKKACA